MTDREKLVELLNESFATQYEKRGLLTAVHTADYLIANGVTVQWRISVEDRLPESGQLYETIDQLKVQLEAALGELKRAAGENAVCIGCKHYGVPIEDSPACTECDCECECEQCKDPCPCASCERASNWEWDGGNV